jgi:hypothetical protein
VAVLVSHSLQSATQGIIDSLGVSMDCMVIQMIESRGNDRSSGVALCSEKEVCARSKLSVSMMTNQFYVAILNTK